MEQVTQDEVRRVLEDPALVDDAIYVVIRLKTPKTDEVGYNVRHVKMTEEQALNLAHAIIRKVTP